jgi:aldehyde dehydrogenase
VQVSEDLIRSVLAEVLTNMRNGAAAPANGKAGVGAWGVFADVNGAAAAATEAQREFERRPLDDRAKAVECVRRICLDNAEELGRDEFEETKIGRLEHKIEKLVVAGTKVPGVEFLRTDCTSGGHGVTLTEYAPFGVIGAITPVTHSLPTLAGNAINMLASGNAVVVNPHPSGARVACKGVQLFNKAIAGTIGIENLVTIVGEPTLETAQAVFDHRDIRLLVVTGGPAVARAALKSPKRAIVAGPGNPPVVVDETADLENAAKSIVAGAAYDNNLLCIAEKEVFVVESVFDELMDVLSHHNAVRLDAKQAEALTAAAFATSDDGKKVVLNKDLIGQDAAVLAAKIGLKVPAGTLILYAETDESNPFVDHEQMMPFVPFVRVPDVDTAIALAKEYEHGYKHTAIIHSRNVETITRMGRELDTTLFVQNGPCMAGLGLGGEGYLSFSIATPTGEGVTTPLTFTRQRRSVTVNAMRVL